VRKRRRRRRSCDDLREMWILMLSETMERKKYVEDLGLFSVAKAE